jgi:hypothetical protein
VLQRLCHRCQSVLHVEDEGTLVFCWNCGAAQVTLSEELQELGEAQRAEFAAASQLPADGDSGSMLQVPDLLVLWKPMIGIAAIVAVALSVISVILPPIELLSWMAPGVVLAIYASRHRQTYITAGVGARVGLVCGVLVSFGMTASFAVFMLIERYGPHHGIAFDQMWQKLQEQKPNFVAEYGQAAANAAIDPFVRLSEFHAGFIIAMIGFLVAIVVLLSIAGGALAGFVRSRTRTPAR